jgi:TetR/AcrR family transcriptional regulator
VSTAWVTATVSALDTNHVGLGAQRFITSEHWRLQQLFPDELAEATRPFADLLEGEIRAAADAGLLHPSNPGRDAWLITRLVMSVFHHYAYASGGDDAMADDLWSFCLNALGGPPTP